MTLRHILSTVGVATTVAAVTGLAKRDRIIKAAVPRELRHPSLYLPLNLTGATTLALYRNLVRRNVRASTQPGVHIEQRILPGTSLTARVYTPSTRAEPSGALLWLHGGGTVMSTEPTEDAWCGRVAGELDVPVVSVDYRLAPEHPYPAGLDDCYAALRWMHDNAAELGVDPSRIAVGGASAGGGLAAALAQRAHDTDIPVCFQLLSYPMIDDRTALRSPDNRTPYTWTPASNRFAWTAYLGHPPRPDDDRAYIAAARRADLTGLPPAWIGVGSLDLFHDESVDYAYRFREAGVPCELLVESGMYHAADLLFDGTVASMTAYRNSMLDALRNALSPPHKSPLPRDPGLPDPRRQ